MLFRMNALHIPPGVKNMAGLEHTPVVVDFHRKIVLDTRICWIAFVMIGNCFAGK